MSRLLARLWLGLWHLIPANPILVRVVNGASRRSRHLFLRAGYLTALLAVVLFSLIASMSGQSGSLAELAKGASQTFKFASFAQLALMCFLAPVFAAAAITQERDARTFHILLSTPLTSAQIVFGSLMSRLYFVFVLLLAGLPIFLMTMLYGGVTSKHILQSFALSGASALVAGALAIAIAMIRVGTRRTIFSFYLLIASYLVSLYLLAIWKGTWVEASPANLDGVKMSWLTPLHPFLALDVALDRVHAPAYHQLTGYSAPVRYALAYPAAAFVVWTFGVAFLLTVGSIFFVRRGAKVGEPTLLGSLADLFSRRRGDRLTRPPRTVWRNPIAWRESRTHTGAGTLLHWIFIAGGLLGCLYLLYQHVRGPMTAEAVRPWVACLILLEFAVALIVATNTAATSMTKEKEFKTMDLLLTTPLTSKYILWGKLRGLVGLTMPLLLGPVLVLLLFGVYGLSQSGGTPAVWVEVALEVGLLLLIYTACACVIGLRISLIARKNATAVMGSVSLVILLFGGATALALALVENAGGEFGAFFSPFAPFTAVWFLIDPQSLFATAKQLAEHGAAARFSALIGSVVAIAMYAFIVWSVYMGLVRNFDMIVRKQSGL